MAPELAVDPPLLTEFKAALVAWRAVYRRFGSEGLGLGVRLARLVAIVEAEGVELNAASQAIACVNRMAYLLDPRGVEEGRRRVR